MLSPLYWDGAVGPTGETHSSTKVSCNRISVQEMASKTVAAQYFGMETEAKDVGIKQMLHRMYIQLISLILVQQRKKFFLTAIWPLLWRQPHSPNVNHLYFTYST